MKRIALLAAALTSGCVVSTEPPLAYGYGDAVVYWNFSRHTAIAPFSVLYDGNLNPLGVSRACSDSGVEYVTVTDLAGNLIDPFTPTIPCIFTGVQGATFLTFPAGMSYTFVVHGYRTVNASPVEVHRGQGSVYVYANQSNPVTVTAGIQRDLDVFLYEGLSLFICLGGDTLGYTLVDGLGTIIDQVTGLTCGNPIAFRVASSTGVDLDGLDIRVQVTNTGTVVRDSCVSQPFDHFANDTATFGWAVALYNTCV